MTIREKETADSVLGDNLVCVPAFVFASKIPERISNEPGSHVEMPTSTASCRAKHIQTHIRPCAFVLYDHLEPVFALDLRFNGCEAECRCIAGTESIKTTTTQNWCESLNDPWNCAAFPYCAFVFNVTCPAVVCFVWMEFQQRLPKDLHLIDTRGN